MCGGGAGKLLKGGLNLLDAATFGGVSLATAGLGLTGNDPFGKGLGLGDLLSGPQVPDMPEIPTGQAPSGAGVADAAQLAAQARERRRAAARFGRASTIGAGSVGAPAGGGKTAIGS